MSKRSKKKPKLRLDTASDLNRYFDYLDMCIQIGQRDKRAKKAFKALRATKA